MDNHIVTFLAFLGLLAIIAGARWALNRKQRGTGGSFSRDSGSKRER